MLKKNLIKNLFFLIYPVCLILLWGTCFFDINANKITCGIGLVLTFVSAFLIQKERGFKNLVWQKIFVIVIMIGATSIFIKRDGFLIYLGSPFFIGILFLVFNFFVFKDLRKMHNNIFFVLVTLIFVQGYFEPWHFFHHNPDNKEASLLIDETENESEKQILKKQRIPPEALDISSFSFMDLKKDTINLISSKPYIFIETWNETCFPCKRGIKELTPLLDSVNTQVDSYFIYESNKFNPDDFVKFTKRNSDLSGQNVLADYSLDFYNSLFMRSYPVFMIIDNNEQKIIYMEAGYSKPIKKRITEKLKGL